MYIYIRGGYYSNRFSRGTVEERRNRDAKKREKRTAKVKREKRDSNTTEMDKNKEKELLLSVVYFLLNVTI